MKFARTTVNPKRTFVPDESLPFAVTYEQFRADWFARIGDELKSAECRSLAEGYRKRLAATLTEHISE